MLTRSSPAAALPIAGRHGVPLPQRSVRTQSHAPCSYEIVTARAGFDSLATEWNDLFARAGRGSQVFQSFNWNWHWCNHYLSSGRSLAIVTGRRAGRLVMVIFAEIILPPVASAKLLALS